MQHAYAKPGVFSKPDTIAQKLEALGTLVAGVAHEINTPVNLLILNIPVLHGIWIDFKPVDVGFRLKNDFPQPFSALNR